MTFVIGIADDITCIRHGAGYTVGLEVHLVHHILDAFAELVIIAQSVTDVQLQILKRFPFQVSGSIKFFAGSICAISFVFGNSITGRSRFSISHGTAVFTCFRMLVQNTGDDIF